MEDQVAVSVDVGNGRNIDSVEGYLGVGQTNARDRHHAVSRPGAPLIGKTPIKAYVHLGKERDGIGRGVNWIRSGHTAGRIGSAILATAHVSLKIIVNVVVIDAELRREIKAKISTMLYPKSKPICGPMRLLVIRSLK